MIKGYRDFYYNVEDRARIERCGGKILGEADQDWGHMLVFEDVDGNVIKLMKPKY
jgi:hypothetical protein